ncbi:MAG TPA: universal stress protein [Candidatus Binatia bacterium]|nr:universal stress protein [Candidatus Binatia bacterium]
MDLIKKILAPTDLSSFSASGVRYACTLAKALGAEVIVAHALSTSEFTSHATSLKMTSPGAEADDLLDKLKEHHKQMLRKFMEEQLVSVGPDLNVQQIVEIGDAHTLIVNWARDRAVDLIVMSTHGRSGLPRMLLGSVTEKVLRSASCPVLAIPSHER